MFSHPLQTVPNVNRQRDHLHVVVVIDLITHFVGVVLFDFSRERKSE
jgi:hypothetical protein